MRLEGLGKLKNPSDLIGNRTRDLPACSIVSEPTTPNCAPLHFLRHLQIALETPFP
jgi:hypothetical protein